MQWFLTFIVASDVLQSTGTTLKSHRPIRNTGRQADQSRPDHPLQPGVQSRSCLRSGRIGLGSKVEGMVGGQERKTGQLAAKTRGDDPRRTTKDRSTGERQGESPGLIDGYLLM
jgi:hypothetical protein